MTESEQKFKRRRRLSRPTTLVFFGVVFLLLPFLNYFAYSYRYGIPLRFVGLILETMPLPFMGLMLLSFPVGIGLLLVQKWGWFLFLGYAGLLVSYDLYVIFTNPDPYNFLALLNAVLGCAAVMYFARKDVSAPYMKMYPRGWRGQKRVPHVMQIKVEDTELKTRDLSATGFYADWPNCPYNPNDGVRLRFELDGEIFDIRGGVVRVDDNGAGIAFRDLSDEQSRLLEKYG